MIENIETFAKIIYGFPVYALSYAYCAWRIAKRARKTAFGNIGDESAGFEFIICMFCPAFFAATDLIVTGYQKLRTYFKSK